MALILALGNGCADEGPPRLSDEDMVWVEHVVQQVRTRLMYIKEPPASPDALDSLLLDLPLEDPQGPLAHLWQDPEKGRVFLQAVHDSLTAMRSELFPPKPPPTLPGIRQPPGQDDASGEDAGGG